MRTCESEHVRLLSKLIEEALSKPLSFEESHEIKDRLADLLLTMTDGASELYETGLALRRWLDDWDIRQRDIDYAEVTTRRLRGWCDLTKDMTRDSLGAARAIGEYEEK